MVLHRTAGTRSRHPVRMAVMAAALAVIGCFSAAATFANTPGSSVETGR